MFLIDEFQFWRGYPGEGIGIRNRLKSFGMFGGREEQVKLLVHNRLAGVIIDRFGKDIMMIPADEEHFTVHVDVAVSGQFISWVFSLGDEVKILGPEPVVEQVHREIRRLTEQYGV